MSHRLGNFFAVTEHEKQSEQKNEQVQKKRKDILYQATHFGRQKSSHFGRSALCRIGKVHLRMDCGKCRFTQSSACPGTALSGDCSITCAFAPASIACLAVKNSNSRAGTMSSTVTPRVLSRAAELGLKRFRTFP